MPLQQKLTATYQTMHHTTIHGQFDLYYYEMLMSALRGLPTSAAAIQIYLRRHQVFSSMCFSLFLLTAYLYETTTMLI